MCRVRTSLKFPNPSVTPRRVVTHAGYKFDVPLGSIRPSLLLKSADGYHVGVRTRSLKFRLNNAFILTVGRHSV